MKYIRTGKNDTWESVYEVIGQQELYWVIKDDEFDGLVPKCNVIKQSDKLEDLCDEFIIIIPAGISRIGTYYARYEGWGDFKWDWREFKEKNGDDYRNYQILGAYGAIWVNGTEGEPILKSVAKMNDDGELELL